MHANTRVYGYDENMKRKKKAIVFEGEELLKKSKKSVKKQMVLQPGEKSVQELHKEWTEQQAAKDWIVVNWLLSDRPHLEYLKTKKIFRTKIKFEIFQMNDGTNFIWHPDARIKVWPKQWSSSHVEIIERGAVLTFIAEEKRKVWLNEQMTAKLSYYKVLLGMHMCYLTYIFGALEPIEKVSSTESEEDCSDD